MKLRYAQSTENRLGILEVMMHCLINTTGSSNKLNESPQWLSHLNTLSTKVLGVTQICPAILNKYKYKLLNTKEGILLG